MEVEFPSSVNLADDISFHSHGSLEFAFGSDTSVCGTQVIEDRSHTLSNTPNISSMCSSRIGSFHRSTRAISRKSEIRPNSVFRSVSSKFLMDSNYNSQAKSTEFLLVSMKSSQTSSLGRSTSGKSEYHQNSPKSDSCSANKSPNHGLRNPGSVETSQEVESVAHIKVEYEDDFEEVEYEDDFEEDEDVQNCGQELSLKPETSGLSATKQRQKNKLDGFKPVKPDCTYLHNLKWERLRKRCPNSRFPRRRSKERQKR